jgi:hypothetical protein
MEYFKRMVMGRWGLSCKSPLVLHPIIYYLNDIILIFTTIANWILYLTGSVDIITKVICLGW